MMRSTFLRISIILFLFLVQQTYAQQCIMVADRELIPEGIAVNSRNHDIYITSIAKHKIVKIDASGKATDFISSGQDEFLEGLGMKVDHSRNVLWALSNKREGKLFTSRIHGFDLTTGARKYYYSQQDTAQHLFNDLVIDGDNNLIISDTYYSVLYKYNPNENQLVLWIGSPDLKWPNGLVARDPEHLYVATYGTGIVCVNMETKSIQKLSGYQNKAMVFGLDGLVYRNNALYGIYNADTTRTTNAVIKYTLNADGTNIVKEELIDKGNKDFYDPTTAAIDGDKLYVIANSHLDQFNKNKESTKGIESQLLPLKILVYKLE